MYLGNPNVHNSGTILSSGGFLRAFKTRNRFSATSVDQLPHHRAAVEMFGHPLMLPIPDVDRTDYFLVMGANPLASNGSIMTAPGMRDRIKAVQARGGRVIVIDPRRTETADVADEHHFIRPGADALFLLAIVDAIFEAGAADLGRLAAFTDGVDALRNAARAFPARRVARAHRDRRRDDPPHRAASSPPRRTRWRTAASACRCSRSAGCANGWSTRSTRSPATSTNRAG